MKLTTSYVIFVFLSVHECIVNHFPQHYFFHQFSGMVSGTGRRNFPYLLICVTLGESVFFSIWHSKRDSFCQPDPHFGGRQVTKTIRALCGLTYVHIFFGWQGPLAADTCVFMDRNETLTETGSMMAVINHWSEVFGDSVEYRLGADERYVWLCSKP